MKRRSLSCTKKTAPKYRKRIGFGGVFLFAAILPFGSTALADCCDSLDERVSELESTTARSGTSKVNLTVSGRVSHQVTWWDDGVESNAYVTGAGAPTHFKFTGNAQIHPGWTAGYILQIEMYGPQRYQLSQDDSSGAGPHINLWQSAWHINSKDFGRLAVGRQSHASDDTALAVDASGSLGPANWVLHDGSGFFALVDGVRTGFRWGGLAYCHHIGGGFGADCNGATTDSVRYDTPTWGGLSFSASWGLDDFWDVAVRYAEVIGDFKFSAAAAYSRKTDRRTAAFNNLPRHSQYTQAGVYIEHVPTGIFAHAAYGHEDNDHVTTLGNRVVDNDTIYLKAGIRHRWFGLGATVLYAEYGQHADMLSEELINAGATSSELNRYGFGVVQEIDAAAMSVWLKYRLNEGEISNLGGMAGTMKLDDLQFIGSGATINF